MAAAIPGPMPHHTKISPTECPEISEKEQIQPRHNFSTVAPLIQQIYQKLCGRLECSDNKEWRQKTTRIHTGRHFGPWQDFEFLNIYSSHQPINPHCLFLARWLSRDVCSNLVICPLETLLNGEKDIQLHFHPWEIPYCIFHGRNPGDITQGELMNSLVVLTTYEIIGTSGSHLTRLPMIEDLSIFWFGLVFDEVQQVH